MQTIMMYQADDGKIFDDYTACQRYEEKLNEQKYAPLTNLIVFYDYNGKEIPYAKMFRDSTAATYALVKEIPKEEDGEIYDLWFDIIPSDLCDILYGDTGWFVCHECNWYGWDEYARDYLDHQKILRSLGAEV